MIPTTTTPPTPLAAQILPGAPSPTPTMPAQTPATTSITYQGCDMGDRLMHVAAMAAANITTALIVGNLVFRKTKTWVLPAIAGAVTGQVAASLTGIGMNSIRNRQC